MDKFGNATLSFRGCKHNRKESQGGVFPTTVYKTFIHFVYTLNIESSIIVFTKTSSHFFRRNYEQYQTWVTKRITLHEYGITDTTPFTNSLHHCSEHTDRHCLTDVLLKACFIWLSKPPIVNPFND